MSATAVFRLQVGMDYSDAYRANLTFAGWSDGQEHDQYSVEYYFGVGTGQYLGPDCDGIEPLFTNEVSR